MDNTALLALEPRRYAIVPRRDAAGTGISDQLATESIVQAPRSRAIASQTSRLVTWSLLNMVRAVMTAMSFEIVNTDSLIPGRSTNMISDALETVIIAP
jgi:hypothetical protein